MGINVSHKIPINGQLLEKYIAVQIGVDYSETKNKVLAIIFYELIYDKNYKICDGKEVHTFEVPEVLEDFCSSFEFSKDNRGQTEIILINRMCIYSYDFSTEALRENINF